MFRRIAQCALGLTALALLAFAWRCDVHWFQRHVFLPQQFFIPAPPSIAASCRAVAAISGLLLLLAIPAVPRSASPRRWLLALAIAAAGAEGLARWRIRRLINPEVSAAMSSLTTVHPRYGLTFRASMDRLQQLSGRQLRFRTDAEGRRFPGKDIDPSLPSLVFTGESAMAGFGLQWDETFPALVGARLHLQVVNLASPAYRLDQSLLRLEDALAELQRPVAVIGMFMPGLIARSFADQHHPRVRRSASGEIEMLPPQRPRLIDHSALVRLWNHLYWSEESITEGMSSVSIVLREIDARARQRGAPCVFVVSGNAPRPMLHELFEVPDIPFVVVDVPESELLADGHPGPAGSLRIADALERWLRATLRKSDRGADEGRANAVPIHEELHGPR